MRAARPRRLEQVVPFVGAAEPADLIDTLSRLSACNFMVIVCDFSVTWTCGAPEQFTSVMVPTIEYTLVDSANSGGASAGSAFGVVGAEEMAAGGCAGSVLRSIRRPVSDDGLVVALSSGAAVGAGGGGGCLGEVLVTTSPGLPPAMRSLDDS